MYPRLLTSIIKELPSEFRIVYLTGPRQAGKTTLVQGLTDQLDMGYMTLDNPTILASAENDSRGFIQSLDERCLVLDEFQ